MKLSMWILADWLTKHSPVLHIKDGASTLSGVRVFSSETVIKENNVYLGRSKDFITSGSNNVICVHGHDMIILQTSDVELVLNEIYEAFDFYNNWSDGIKYKLYKGCTLQQIIDESSTVFDDPIVVYDSGTVAIAYSSQFGLGSLDDEWDSVLLTQCNSLEKLYKLNSFLKDNIFGREVKVISHKEFSRVSMWRNIYFDKKFIGRMIIIENNHKITPGRVCLCDELGNLIEEWICYNTIQNEVRENYEFLIDLLDGNPVEKDNLVQRLEIMSWFIDDPKIVINITTLSSNIILKPLILILKRTFNDCFIFEYQNNTIIIINLKIISHNSFLKLIKPLLKQSNSYCGVSYEFSNIEDIKTHYDQSVIALKYCSKQIGEIYFCKDYALEYFYSFTKSQIKVNIIHPGLLTLKKYDSFNQSDLFDTLYHYILNERNLVKTASILCMHRNTLLYRLNRIKELTDIDLDDSYTRELLLISFNLIEV